MANKKLYTDFAEVTTSLLTDLVPTLQTTMKKTTLQKILNLFRANADSSLTEKGFIELATQEEVNAGTDAVRALTPLTLKNSTQWAAKLSTGNAANTATGLSEVDLDGNSGIAIFTTTINHNQTAEFVINNADARVSSMWLFSVKYSGGGFPSILHHTTSDAAVTIHIGNINIGGGSSNTNANIAINFILLNP